MDYLALNLKKLNMDEGQRNINDNQIIAQALERVNTFLVTPQIPSDLAGPPPLERSKGGLPCAVLNACVLRKKLQASVAKTDTNLGVQITIKKRTVVKRRETNGPEKNKNPKPRLTVTIPPNNGGPHGPLGPRGPPSPDPPSKMDF